MYKFKKSEILISLEVFDYTFQECTLIDTIDIPDGIRG